MAYFNGIKKGDKVWDFLYGEGKVYEVESDSEDPIIRVKFKSGLNESYNLDGRKFTCVTCNQTLFWDKFEFEAPKSPMVHLDVDYQELIGNKLKGVPTQSLKQIKRFAKLLALRDQESPDSKGYEFDSKRYEKEFYIFRDEQLKKYKVGYITRNYSLGTIYFKSEEDAQKICDILNENRFDL